MNLIEELGLEKCQAIVDGAPKHAEYYSPLSYSNKYKKSVRDNTYEPDVVNGYTKSYDFWDGRKWNGCACMLEHLDDLILISSIRTAIAEHDQHWYGQSEEKELEQYAILSQEKIEGGAMLVGDFKNNLTSSEYKNYFQAERMRTVVNAGTAVTNHIATANKDITDHCTDIRNHISPNTKVSER